MTHGTPGRSALVLGALVLLSLASGCAGEAGLRRAATREVGGLDFAPERIYQALIKTVVEEGFEVEVADPIHGQVRSYVRVHPSRATDEVETGTRVEGRVLRRGERYVAEVFAGRLERPRVEGRGSGPWSLEAADHALVERLVRSFRKNVGLW